MILFPQDTWKQKGGLRKDLVQLLADMKPGFVRFPSGCIVEGRTLERYQWKKTIGPVEKKINQLGGIWNLYRPLTGLFSNLWSGLFRIFSIAEDIGGRTILYYPVDWPASLTSEMTPMEKLDPSFRMRWISLNLPTDKQSTLGSVRASMGHPTPFNLKFIE